MTMRPKKEENELGAADRLLADLMKAEERGWIPKDILKNGVGRSKHESSEGGMD